MDYKYLFNEINFHLLNDPHPSKYLDILSNNGIFKEYPFNILLAQKQTKQWLKYHPEGVVWNHTLLVIDKAAEVKNESKDPQVFMWAALLHDIGKPDTTKEFNGKITSYNHEKIGEKLAEEFLLKMECDAEFIKKVKSLIRWHMQILFVIKNPKFANINEMTKQTDLNEIALLGFCDRMGRLNADLDDEKRNIAAFINKVTLMKQ
ncbi:MAG: HDIG domain-containing protein [Eubacteriaceae bacterium]|nr:HDIG domain-containing protein [Eubacteriaceae bacterium]